MKVRTLTAAVAAAAIALVFSQPIAAQEKRVRINMGAAFPSAMAMLGPGQLYFVEKVKKLSGGSIDIRFFEPVREGDRICHCVPIMIIRAADD